MRHYKTKINFKYNLSVYWGFLKNHKVLFFGLAILSFVLAAVSVVDKFLFRRIIDDGALFITEGLSKEVFMQTLIIIAIIFIVSRLAWTIGDWLKFHFVIRLDSKLKLDVKRKYFNHIIGLSHKFHTTHKTGALISRLNRGTNAVEGMTDNLAFNFTPLIFNLIVVGFSLAFFSLISALVIALTAVIFIAYSFYIQQIQQKARLEYNERRDREKGFIGDIFVNIDSIKYFGKERNIHKLFSGFITRTKSAQIKHGGYYRWFEAGQVFILGISTFFLIYFPLMSFLDGELTLGTLVFIYSIYGNIIGPMFGFVWGMRSFYRAMADFQGLFEYGKIQNDIKEKPNAKSLKIEKGEIEFKNVDFSYGRKKAFSLDDFSLRLKKNEKIAFVGRSGCGKTTLVKLLYRLYDVKKGEVLIDGKNIKDFKQESLRGELSIVPQECVLFDDTIYNNIKFSNPKATKGEVWKAIKFAQLDKFIENLPDKEKTVVGERGIKLSGGEKQRVSIARAILANKKVLVLDEATSSLDSETEHEIQKSLQKLLEGRTSIIIAHRLSTIMNADRIIVMKGGKIIQQGKHNELIKKEGEYKKLWNLQKGGYIK